MCNICTVINLQCEVLLIWHPRPTLPLMIFHSSFRWRKEPSVVDWRGRPRQARRDLHLDHLTTVPGKVATLNHGSRSYDGHCVVNRNIPSPTLNIFDVAVTFGMWCYLPGPPVFLHWTLKNWEWPGYGVLLQDFFLKRWAAACKLAGRNLPKRLGLWIRNGSCLVATLANIMLGDWYVETSTQKHNASSQLRCKNYTRKYFQRGGV